MTMLSTMQTRVIATLLTTLSALTVAEAQQNPSTSSKMVRPAAYERSESNAAVQSVRFGRRPARIGDEVEQTLAMDVRLTTSFRKGNEIVEKNQSAMRSKQNRTVVTTAVDDGRAVGVRVRYDAATKQMGLGDGATGEMAAEAQPIAGKTYLVKRESGDAGKLIVTDEEGHLPSLEEYEIVASNMEMVGRPNPLAEFLAGRTLKTGQTLELPQNIANQVFNLGQQFGDVTRFDLTLEKMEVQDGARCAVFTAHVEASASGSSQMGMQVEGPFVVQTDTCRAVKVDLSGPIGMSETRGSYSTAYQIIGTGQLKVGIASTYRDAKR
jgi:hypothetical protein